MSLDTETAQDFLKIAPQFKLGCLLTEQQNPITIGLSNLAKNDLPNAINTVKKLDVKTMNILKQKISELQLMYEDINSCLQKGGRVFICGCGATGRLSLVLQTLWRQQCSKILPEWKERVISFMAGGDAALIKSVQDFEDHPEFAEQQLIELGFKQGDILIGSTEGGETPWVIGAVWKSTEISSLKPYILYGNTDEILCKNVERSRKFIESPKIHKINCNVGEMALAGSTRMQSTTILMHAIGLTLLGCDRLRQLTNPDVNWKQYAKKNVEQFLEYLDKTDFTVLAPFIEYETFLYKNKQQITYLTDSYYAISILTDTTERSPTFSLIPFKNKYYDSDNHKCWCNLNLIGTQNEQNWELKVKGDWQMMLGGREIRTLDSEYWKNYQKKVSHHTTLGFGMHEQNHHTLTISHPLKFQNQKDQLLFPQYPSSCRLSHHSLLKILLNNMSTLIMGRMDRYESNIMTYVKPTNYKLIDRATRYAMALRPGSKYEDIVKIIYDIRYKIGADEPIVLKVIEVLDKMSE